MQVHRIYAGWGQYAGFESSYVFRFPPGSIVACGALRGNAVLPGVCSVEADGQPIAVFVELAADTDEIVVFGGHSFTSTELASSNMQIELASAGTFDRVLAAARSAWESALCTIQISGATDDNMTTFYTAMYHSLLHPRVFSDLDRNLHVAFDSNNVSQSVVTEAAPYYDDFSMWDTFRVVLPLLTIIQPEKYTALMRSLVGKFRQGGWLPIFPCWNSYTNEMIGDHAIAILADGVAKGLFPETDGFSIKEVFDAGWKNAMQVPSAVEAANGAGRRALAEYIAHGYVPVDADTGKNQQVSISLEYAYDDFALSRLADRLSLGSEASVLLERSESWRYLMDNSTGSWYVRGRYKNGTFVASFDPFAGPPGQTSAPSWITEASAFEYTWFVPHNIGGLVALFGGASAFVEKLRFFFDGGHYDAGNEPDIQVGSRLLVPRCAVLCCAVLCCAVLCCAVLCCAVLCCAGPTVSRSITACPACMRKRSQSNPA